VDVVPLLDACHGWKEGDDQLWLSGRGAIRWVQLQGVTLWLSGRRAFVGTIAG